MKRCGATLRNTLRRLGRIRSVLALEPMTTSQLAVRLGYSVRTVQRDLELLREFFGAPIERHGRGVNGPFGFTNSWPVFDLKVEALRRVSRGPGGQGMAAGLSRGLAAGAEGGQDGGEHEGREGH